nr:hypothetical protein [Paraburkholderia nodosa]
MTKFYELLGITDYLVAGRGQRNEAALAADCETSAEGPLECEQAASHLPLGNIKLTGRDTQVAQSCYREKYHEVLDVHCAR